MKNFLKNYRVQIIVAILTIAFISYFSFFGSGNDSDRESFRNVFIPLAIFSYIAYLILSSLALWLVRRFKFPTVCVYIGHIVAFLIGYFFFYEIFLSIATGGIPMFL